VKNIATYEVDRLSPAQCMERRLERDLKLAPRMMLPTTPCALGVYVEQLLTAAEQEVCNAATD